VGQSVGGYNVDRKQAMLRVLTRSSDNSLKMVSQSLDGSNRQALESLYRHFGYEAAPGELLGQRMNLDLDEFNQEYVVDELVGVYDRNLQSQFGGEWFAGRQDARRRNTYDFACQQQDLVGAYLASTDYFDGGINE